MKRLKIILTIGIIFTTINSSNIVQAAKLDNNKIGWQSINGYWCYLNKNGSKATGWNAINGDWYYLKSDGSMAKGWQSINGHWYYLNENGTMAKGWQSINGHWYYLNEDGSMAAGWKAINGVWYYLEADGRMVTGWHSINGKNYYFEKNGKLNSNIKENITKRIVEEANKHIGKPYQWGATGPESFDCSGFTRYVFEKFKFRIGRTTYDQINIGQPISYNNLQPGDLVFSGGCASSPRHVGIYIGNGKIIHSPRTGECVKVGKIYHFVAARRVVN